MCACHLSSHAAESGHPQSRSYGSGRPSRGTVLAWRLTAAGLPFGPASSSRSPRRGLHQGIPSFIPASRSRGRERADSSPLLTIDSSPRPRPSPTTKHRRPPSAPDNDANPSAHCFDLPVYLLARTPAASRMYDARVGCGPGGCSLREPRAGRNPSVRRAKRNDDPVRRVVSEPVVASTTGWTTGGWSHLRPPSSG